MTESNVLSKQSHSENTELALLNQLLCYGYTVTLTTKNGKIVASITGDSGTHTGTGDNIEKALSVAMLYADMAGV